jgi:hypothetical protein
VRFDRPSRLVCSQRDVSRPPPVSSHRYRASQGLPNRPCCCGALVSLGTLRTGTCGLFVSTGGFTRDAEEEVGRAHEPVTLLDRDAFIQLMPEHHEALESEYKAQIPLRCMWVPPQALCMNPLHDQAILGRPMSHSGNRIPRILFEDMHFPRVLARRCGTGTRQNTPRRRQGDTVSGRCSAGRGLVVRPLHARLTSGVIRGASRCKTPETASAPNRRFQAMRGVCPIGRVPEVGVEPTRRTSANGF